MMSSWVLLVEPDGAVRERLRSVAVRFGHVDVDAQFPAARKHLLSNPYDWVVTNIRLTAYNGLHLMHLAAAARLRARFVVYADHQDVLLGREARRAGAFYEARDQVHRALAVCGQRCRRTTAAMLTCGTAAASGSVAAAGARM